MNDAFDVLDLGATLGVAGLLGCAACGMLINVNRDHLRALWRFIVSGVRGPRHSDLESFLAQSMDRFELERRERALSEGDRRDGSLLGG